MERANSGTRPADAMGPVHEGTTSSELPIGLQTKFENRNSQRRGRVSIFQFRVSVFANRQSLVPQRHNGINLRRPAGGQVAGDEGHDGEDADGQRERQGVVRGEPEEKLLE